jgi:uncharacterized protein YndB with AHSA1/START domain
MSRRPTGRVVPTAHGADLVITRTFQASLEDVWTSVTDPESTARWIGRWSGDAGPGKYINLKFGFEKDSPEVKMLIESCEPPRHLVVSSKDEHGEWHLELSLASRGEETELTFVQHLADPKLAGDIGPGWEYYLDMLVASRRGEPLPDFAEYYPAQRAYYLGEV